MDTKEKPWALPIEKIFEYLETSDKGLTTVEAHKRLEKYGSNRITEKEKRHEPTKARIIATSRDRSEIYEKQKQIKGDIAILYTGEIPRKGYAVAFYGYLEEFQDVSRF